MRFFRPRDRGQDTTPTELGEHDDRPEETPQEPSKVTGDRGIASINRARSLQSRLSNLLAMGLMVGLGAGLLTWYYAHALSRSAHVNQAAASASRAKVQGDMPLPALGRVDPPASAPSAADPSLAERVLGPAPAPPPDATAGGLVVGAPVPYRSGTRKSASQRALDRQLAGPAFSAASGNGPSDAAPEPSGVAAGRPDEPHRLAGSRDSESGSATGGDTSMAGLLKPSITPAVQAQVLPTQTLLLPKGAFIDCTLETAIDSSLPGLTTCITATDTFGADGQVVLLERGTKLVGETRGTVQQGAPRVFVLWTEARTPTGVVVPLASPGTDELGRSGLPGAVNRHFLERFGAAMMISVIDGAVQAAVASKSGGGAVIYNPTSSEDVMTEVLKSTVNVSPTIVKQNGDRIQILVARDLDFRSVYALRTLAARP